MKIEKRIKTNVSASVENCKKAIKASIRELCEMVDYKYSGKILFKRAVPLTTTMVIHEKHLQTRTVFVDSIGWNVNHEFFALYLDDEIVTSSIYTSVDDLMAIYKALEKVVNSF